MPPKITLPNGATVSAPKDAGGKGAEVSQDQTKTTFEAPAGTHVTTEKTEATPTAPAKETTTWDFSKPTKFEIDASTLRANTGAVDSTVATHAQDLASKGPLLWAAIGSLIVAAAMIYFEHPTAAMLCGAAGAIFFAAWKLADLPPWFYMVAVAALVGGACLVFGHAKGVKNTVAAIIAKTP